MKGSDGVSGTGDAVSPNGDGVVAEGAGVCNDGDDALIVGDGVSDSGAGVSGTGVGVPTVGAGVSVSGDGVLGTGAASFGLCSQGTFHVSSISQTSSSLLMKPANTPSVQIVSHYMHASCSYVSLLPYMTRMHFEHLPHSNGKRDVERGLHALVKLHSLKAIGLH